MSACQRIGTGCAESGQVECTDQAVQGERHHLPERWCAHTDSWCAAFPAIQRLAAATPAIRSRRTCTQSSRRTCTKGRARSARRTCTKGRARSARRRTCTQCTQRSKKDVHAHPFLTPTHSPFLPPSHPPSLPPSLSLAVT